MSLQKEKSALDFNLSYLSDIGDGSNEFMVDMLNLILSQTPDQFNQLEEAVDKKDWVEVANAAHKIKPAMEMIGLESVKDRVYRIEILADNKAEFGLIEAEFYSLRNMSADIANGLQEIKLLLCKQ